MTKRKDFIIVEREKRYIIVRKSDKKESVPFKRKEDAEYVIDQIIKGVIKP